jgi:hypothetical protein
MAMDDVVRHFTAGPQAWDDLPFEETTSRGSWRSSSSCERAGTGRWMPAPRN